MFFRKPDFCRKLKDDGCPTSHKGLKTQRDWNAWSRIIHDHRAGRAVKNCAEPRRHCYLQYLCSKVTYFKMVGGAAEMTWIVQTSSTKMRTKNEPRLAVPSCHVGDA